MISAIASSHVQGFNEQDEKVKTLRPDVISFSFEVLCATSLVQVRIKTGRDDEELLRLQLGQGRMRAWDGTAERREGRREGRRGEKRGEMEVECST